MISISGAVRAVVAGPALAALAAAAVTVGGGPAVAATAGPAAAARAATPGPCASSALKLRWGPSDGTAGSVIVVVDFVNTSRRTCTLYGFPGVSFTGGHPLHRIGLPAAWDHTFRPRLVTLRPGRMAHTAVQIVDAQNYRAKTCRPVRASHLKVYPPNQKAPLQLRGSFLACSRPVQQLFAQAVRPGIGG